MPETTVDVSPRELRTVDQFAERWEAWTRPALRNLILNARDRFNSRGEKIEGNGLEEAGAIIRLGRRVLIDERAFFRWLAVQQKKTNGMTNRGRAAEMSEARVEKRVHKRLDSPLRSRLEPSKRTKQTPSPRQDQDQHVELSAASPDGKVAE